MSAIAQLAFPAPRCEAAVELTRLLGSRDQLEAKLDALDREQRAAAETLAKRSAELVALERRSLEGGEVTPAASRKAEDALTKAKVANAAPWGERRQALREAINNHGSRVQAFVAEHFDQLVEEVEQDGAEAAQAVDTAAAALIEAAHERDDAARRLDALNAAVRGQSKFGDVALARSDAASREAGRLLSQGGEVPPTLRPDLSHQGATVDEPQQVTAA